MQGSILSKGIKWSANRMKRVHGNKAGIFIIFDEDSKTAIVKENNDIIMGLRAEWWKKNFWYFSWFETSPPEYRFELLEELEGKSYEELWEFD